MRVALGLEYDGSSFSGWQSQPQQPTVQDALEAALTKIAAVSIRTHCAGRTDSGVHALTQVVHFDVDTIRPLQAWVRGSNAALPAAVAVRWACQVSDEFHARFSASGRAYRYLLLNRRARPGLLSGRVGWCHHALDVDLMREAACHLRGEHDFSSFRATGCQAKSPVKNLDRLEVTRNGDFVEFELHGNAFLHHMVRNIVGALVYVGMGRKSPGWLGELLAERDRRRAAPTFAADGLYLVGVDYASHWGLPETAAATGMIRPPEQGFVFWR